MPADPIRVAALRRLVRIKPGRPDRDQADAHHEDDPRVRHLVAGVRQRAATLDAIIQPFVHQHVDRLEAPLREALRLGVHGLLHQPETPPPLIVASTVDLAGSSRRRRGFLNAVLRKIATELKHEPAPSAPIRDRHCVLTGPDTVVRFETPVLPDPAEDLPAYLATQFGVPRWFVAEVLPVLGESIDAFLTACNRPLPIALRVNRLKATPETAAAALTAQGAHVLRTLGDVLEVRFDGQVTELPVFKDGWITVQDLVATEAGAFTGAAHGERILDYCAGVGGKSLHLAEISGGLATIVAADVSAVQLARLHENQQRLGTPGITPHQLQAGPGSELAGLFDRVLVDVPCSNSGVLMKRIEARWRLDDKTIARLATTQLDLLTRAAAFVKPGGVLIYSTCSVLHAENEAIVHRFLHQHAGFRLEEARTRWPHETTRDGGFMARLLRTEAASTGS